VVEVTAVNPARRRTPRNQVRVRILRAAMSVFADRGFAGATIDAIAEAAGFTKGAVYSNFGSKDDLFFALLDQQISHRHEMVTELVEDAAARPSPKAVGELLMAELLDNRDWQMIFVEYWLRAMRDPDLRQRFVEHRRAVRAAIGDAVRHLAFESDVAPASITVLVLALSNGLSIEEFIDPGTVPPDLFGAVLDALTTTRSNPANGSDRGA